MQLTIDSTEPLDRVLKVVSSLYGVELAVVSTSGQSPAESATARPMASAGSPRNRRVAKKSSSEASGAKTAERNGGSRRAPVIDLAAVRSWARANGFQVSDRGRVPNAVLEAYREGTRSSS